MRRPPDFPTSSSESGEGEAADLRGVKEDRGEQNLLRVELTGGGMVVGFMFEGDRAERLAIRGGRYCL